MSTDNYEPGLRLSESPEQIEIEDAKENEARRRADELNKMVSKEIPLVEMFGPTIQGEGTVIGQQTYFLRFGLCDYKCVMCDSMHAVNPLLVKKNAQWLTQADIYAKFEEFRASDLNTTKWVTFSGGNPAIHDLGLLLGLMKANNFKINVETQGTMYKGWLNKVDSLTISPKGPGMGENHDQRVFEGFLQKLVENAAFGGFVPNPENVEDNAIVTLPDLCFKIVVFDQRDLDFAAGLYDWLLNESILGPSLKANDPTKHLYLSLGNPNPPPIDGSAKSYDIEEAIKRYRYLSEDIMHHPILSQTRWLPQWHALVWGNDQGH